MKNVKYFFIASLAGCLFSFASYAQKVLSEVTLNYNISIEPVTDKTSISKALDGAVLSIYIKGTESRADMVSSLGTESNLFDTKTGKGFILKEYSGQKLMITLSKENWAQKNHYFQNMKFNIESEEKLIGGYKCKKAIGFHEGKTFIVYYTSEYMTVHREYNNAFKNLPGIPVQFELESGKLKFKYLLTGIVNDNIPDIKFDIPKAGFRIMTYEENQQLKKG